MPCIFFFLPFARDFISPFPPPPPQLPPLHDSSPLEESAEAEDGGGRVRIFLLDVKI